MPYHYDIMLRFLPMAKKMLRKVICIVLYQAVSSLEYALHERKLNFFYSIHPILSPQSICRDRSNLVPTDSIFLCIRAGVVIPFIVSKFLHLIIQGLCAS